MAGLPFLSRFFFYFFSPPISPVFFLIHLPDKEQKKEVLAKEATKKHAMTIKFEPTCIHAHTLLNSSIHSPIGVKVLPPSLTISPNRVLPAVTKVRSTLRGALSTVGR